MGCPVPFEEPPRGSLPARPNPGAVLHCTAWGPTGRGGLVKVPLRCCAGARRDRMRNRGGGLQGSMLPTQQAPGGLLATASSYLVWGRTTMMHDLFHLHQETAVVL